MRFVRVLILVLVCLSLGAHDAEAKKKKQVKRSAHRAVVAMAPFDPSREMVYVRYELLNVFWNPRVEPVLQSGVYGLTPYAGLNAWIAHKVATACVPCELPQQAKDKYCNYWIEDQVVVASHRAFRISPDGWCYPMKSKS